MRLAVATLVLIAALVFLAFGLPRLMLQSSEASSVKTVGKAEFGHGMIRYGGRGPEAWRWQLVKEKRRAHRLQRRLTARVLQVRSLRRQVGLLDRLNFDPVLAIRVVFGPYSEQALRVVRCESRFDLGATNGQYRGLFQMGSSERATYGHGNTALEQARAAYAYFVASGRDWSPWECKP